MRPDLGNQLRLKHAAIFRSPVPASLADMVDPFQSIKDGWYTLLDVLCTNLQHDTDNAGAPQIRALQLGKELGGLRFRVDQASDRQRGMISLIERLSVRTCEACGAPAEELSMLFHEPHCERHMPSQDSAEDDLPTSQILLGKFPKWLARKLRRNSCTRLGLEPLAALNQAIRANDLIAVRQALQAGAALQSCTLDNDGFHTPLELAERYGDQRIVNLIAARLGNSPAVR